MDAVPCLAVDDGVVLAGVAFALVDRLADLGAIVQHPVEILLVDPVVARGSDAALRHLPRQFRARSDLEEAGEELLGRGPAPDAEEVDELDEELRAAAGAAADGGHQVFEAGQVAVVAGAQERAARDVADARRLDDDRAGLAAAVQVRLNPADFDKLGVDAGAIVKVVSGKGELMAPVAVDAGVPAGSAAIPANAPDANANQLIDASTSVTDIRVERA